MYGTTGYGFSSPGQRYIQVNLKILYILLVSLGKTLSEALIFASTKPQYENRLFIELQVQYMEIPSSEHGGEQVVYRNCF